MGESAFLLFLCSALQLSNDSDDSYFTGSDGDQRTRSTEERGRLETHLQVHLGEEGKVSIGRQRHGDVADSYKDWHPALDEDPDSADAECVVELRTCSACWISLSAILDRVEELEVGTAKDDRYLTTGNNDGKFNAVNCQLWSVVSVVAPQVCK